MNGIGSLMRPNETKEKNYFVRLKKKTILYDLTSYYKPYIAII